MESEAASGIYSGLMPEPYPFLFKVCDTVDEDCTVELDYLPDGVDCDTSDKVLEGAHCAIGTSSIEKAIEMVRADERALLWSRADDPEVVEAVAESWNGEFWGVYRADEPEESREYPLDRPFTDAVYGSGYEISSMHMATAGSTPTPDELHDLARSSLAAALTALLGPRPNREEAADGDSD